nr:MAG: coat protein [Guiyang fiers-like virus 4]
MPQFVPVSLYGVGSEILTFKPRDITGGVATSVQSSGIPLGDRRISMSTNRASNGKTKLVIKFAFPTLEDITANGVTRKTVSRTNYAEMSFNFDGNSTADERYRMIAALHAWLQEAENPMLMGYVRDLEGIY